MVAKLNELNEAIDSKKLEIKKFRTELEEKLSNLENEQIVLEKELLLAEELVKQAASSGFIKVKYKSFTYPWCHGGGGNPNQRTYGKEKIRYCEPIEALALLSKSEEHGYGSGTEYSKV